jgi:tellurite resistance protein TehA-like permease
MMIILILLIIAVICVFILTPILYPDHMKQEIKQRIQDIRDTNYTIRE